MKTLIIHRLNSAEAELIADLLSALDAEAVSLVNASQEELFQLQPEHSPLWQQTQVEAIYGDETDFNSLMAQLEQMSGKQLSFTIQDVLEQDWVRLTQASFKPIHIANQLSIYPSWHEPENLNPTQLRIDPGLAFGTGTHPTTQLCLEWLAKHKPVGQQVIDYGCGSGILALSAKALGAQRVWAVDHDPQALLATQQNSQLNGFEIFSSLPQSLTTPQVDLVIANILANPLIELAETLLSLLKNGGTLVLSGLLVSETSALLDCYAQHFEQLELGHQEGWARIVLIKKTPVNQKNRNNTVASQ